MAEQFYTTHYYGRTIGEFLDTLTKHGVKTLVDTRSSPTSRQADFEAQNLRSTLEQHSITYVSAPQLGCPRNLRLRAWRTGQYGPLWEWYTKNVIEKVFWGFLATIADKPRPVVFMCVEKDPEKCHRHLIARALIDAGHSVTEI